MIACETFLQYKLIYYEHTIDSWWFEGLQCYHLASIYAKTPHLVLRFDIKSSNYSQTTKHTTANNNYQEYTCISRKCFFEYIKYLQCYEPVRRWPIYIFSLILATIYTVYSWSMHCEYMHWCRNSDRFLTIFTFGKRIMNIITSNYCQIWRPIRRWACLYQALLRCPWTK